MYTIDKNTKGETIIKNSKFITLLFKIESKNDVSDILDNIKKSYPKATHYCYAYIVDSNKKSSDDGEPGGTAGMPILNVLEKEKITNILAIVVRYFGGIKLGAGGLVRAYSKSVKDTLALVNINKLQNGKLIELTFDYDIQDKINYILKDEEIVSKNFDVKITYMVKIKDEILNKLDNYSYKILDNILIEKRS